MARGVKISDSVRAECLRLRIEGRQTFTEIQKATGVPKGSLGSILKGHLLTAEESKKKRGFRPRPAARKPRLEESAVHKSVAGQLLDVNRKGRIAEAAVLFRLTLYGFQVLSPIFDGDVIDWVIKVDDRLVKAQVKWASCRDRWGLPSVSITKSLGHNKRTRYTRQDFDVLLAYDLYSDTVYVFTYDELENNRTHITVRPEAAERWDKLKISGP